MPSRRRSTFIGITGSLLLVVLLLCSSIARAGDVASMGTLVERDDRSFANAGAVEIPDAYSLQGRRPLQSTSARRQAWQTRKSHKHGKHQSTAAKNSHKKGYASSSGSRGGQDYHGKGTFFKPNHGACGNYNNENDYIVALSQDMYDKGKYCEKDVHICHNNKCVDAKVTDLCPGCDHTSLDMSPVVFNALAKPEEGVIDIQWSFQ